MLDPRPADPRVVAPTARCGARIVRAAVVSFLGALALAIASRPARALSLAPMSLAELSGAASVIVRARCEDRQAVRAGDRVESLARFRVLERVKGDASDEEIVIRQLGGKSGGIETIVPGAPLSQPGDEAILFLARSKSGDLDVVGIALGYVPVIAVPGGPPVVRVSSSLALDLGGGGMRPATTVLEGIRKAVEAGR